MHQNDTDNVEEVRQAVAEKPKKAKLSKNVFEDDDDLEDIIEIKSNDVIDQ